jgi:hypothetical protein
MSETNATAAAPAPAVVNPPTQSGGSEAPTTPAGRGGGGRGRGHGGRGRGRGDRNRNNRSGAPVRSTAVAAFKGNTDGLKGNVFQCHGENADKGQFLKTVGVLEEHINKTFTYPQDLASVCKSLKIEPLVQPPNLSKEDYEQDMGKKLMWETSMKTYT